MKTLLLIRHAKSSWSELGQPDLERPLNDRGKRDAPVMAERLKDRKIEIDLFVSSHAKRAIKTARIFAGVYDVSKDNIIITTDLYEAQINAFYEVVEKLPAKHDRVAIFSHNPGITDFANTLVKGIRVDNMPTCSIFAVSAEIKAWNEFANEVKKFLFFDYPKKSI